jgi:endonuclease I
MNKLVENEKQFQAHNKRLAASMSRLAPTGLPEDFILELFCECANKACLEKIQIAYQTYAEIANKPRAFAVKPEHYLPEFEKLEQKHSGFWTIIKKPDKLDKPFEV